MSDRQKQEATAGAVASGKNLAGTGARVAEGSGLLSRPASDGRAGSNPAPSVLLFTTTDGRVAEPFLNPPYTYEVALHGPATIYDAIDVGWIARIKESLPHKEKLAALIVRLLNRVGPDVGSEVCNDCGLLVGPHTGGWWHADDDLWLEVMEQDDPGEGPAGRRVGPGILCPPCFTARCDAKGIRIFWHARVEYREAFTTHDCHSSRVQDSAVPVPVVREQTDE